MNAGNIQWISSFVKEFFAGSVSCFPADDVGTSLFGGGIFLTYAAIFLISETSAPFGPCTFCREGFDKGHIDMITIRRETGKSDGKNCSGGRS
jgi:hypothetical protein